MGSINAAQAAVGTIISGLVFIWGAEHYNLPNQKPYREPSRAEIESYIQDKGVAKCGIDAAIWRSLIEQESGFHNNSLRFEPHIVPQAKRLSKDPREIPMLASSHGVLQILGTNAVANGHKWEELYSLDVAFDIGCKMLRNCYSRAKGAGKQKLAQMFSCWNGSSSYGAAVTQKVERSMFDNMKIASKQPAHDYDLDRKGMNNLLARLW